MIICTDKANTASDATSSIRKPEDSTKCRSFGCHPTSSQACMNAPQVPHGCNGNTEK